MPSCWRAATTSAVPTISSDPARTFDTIASRLERGSIEASYADDDGVVRTHTLSRDRFLDATGTALYTTAARTHLLRAIGAADVGDWVPLTQLAMPGGRYVATIDESVFTYYAVTCADYLAAADDPTDVRGYVQAGVDDGLFDLRMVSAYLSAAPCPAWPRLRPPAAPLARLTTTPFPVFVLTSTGDPITPAAAGRRVAASLTDGYLIETSGGSHVSFGRGDPCLDDQLVAYLVDGRRPPARAVECRGALIEGYVPIPDTRRLEDLTAVDAARLIDDEAYMHADFVNWDGTDSIAFGCRFGGRVAMNRSFTEGTWVDVRYEGCAVFDGVAVNGARPVSRRRDRQPVRHVPRG